MTELAARPHGRLVGVRAALTPREWARPGAMAATIIGLNVLGWGMLAAAAGGHHHITGTQLFGFGTGVHPPVLRRRRGQLPRVALPAASP
jgi:hypothetical protein